MKRIYSIFFLTVLLYSCEQPISDFQSENFLKYFGSGFESRGYDVIQLADGTYVLTGYDQPTDGNNQVFVAKTDENGNETWSYTYGTTSNQEAGKVVKEVADGFIIAGTSVTDTLIHSFLLKIGTNGDSLWYKEFGDSTINIVVNDINVDSECIIVAGHTIRTLKTETDYYFAKLSLNGEKLWEREPFDESNSSFKKVFFDGNDYLFIGDDGIENNISIVPVNNFGVARDAENLGTAGETVADARLENNQLYILANAPSYTKLLKISTGFVEEWQTESINSISGKTFTYSENGMLLVLGETIVQTNTLINTIEVDDSGITDYGSNSFRTIQGSIENVKFTTDKGFIIIGSTNATFGTKLQLIKTDRDLFLLRP
jgi:hypothetical protein